MTAKRRLVPTSEVRDVLDLLRDYGVDPSRVIIDIRADGVSFTPPNQEPGNDFDRWIQKDQNSDPVAHR